MFSFVHQEQVFKSIVISYVVDVVNHFIWIQISSEAFLDNNFVQHYIAIRVRVRV